MFFMKAPSELNGHTLPIGIVYPEKALTCFFKNEGKENLWLFQKAFSLLQRVG
jgi:hypothetical protein